MRVESAENHPTNPRAGLDRFQQTFVIDRGSELLFQVYEFLSKTDSTKRAYTTIKTVMDRLYEKEVLLRIKQGKKFFYRTAYSNSDIVITSLKKIASQYCNGDMSKLMRITKSICENDNQILMVN